MIRACFLPNLSEILPQKVELIIMPMKTMVVRKACRYWLIPHSQWRARGRMERIIISMLSAIQQRPTTKLSTIWNLPKPMLLMAWVTVKVSSGTTPLAAAIKEKLDWVR